MSTPWWRSAVLYQVYLRSFADGDGDGLGDFQGCAVASPTSTAGSPWLPLPDSFGRPAVSKQEADPRSSVALHREALGLRRANRALREGSLTWLAAPAGALVIERRSPEETIVCAVNLDAEPLSLPEGQVVLASAPDVERGLPAGTAAWVRTGARAAAGAGRRRTAGR